MGIRGHLYDGLTIARQAEPRLGIAYNVKPTNTVLRVSYARVLEIPFNEKLVLSSIGCQSDVLNPSSLFVKLVDAIGAWRRHLFGKLCETQELPIPCFCFIVC